jgi:Family of unknown function (DUF6049)
VRILAAARCWKRPLRLLGAGVVIVGCLAFVPGTAHGQPAGPVSQTRASASSGELDAVQTGPPEVTLLSQSPWVEKNGTFRLRVQLSALDPSSDRLVINGFERLGNRTDFDRALQGQMVSTAWYSTGQIALSSLPADPSGRGVDLDIPVDVPAPAGSPIPTFSATEQNGSGIFPLQIGLYTSSGVPEGQPLTTFLVYALPQSATDFPRLSVSVILPVTTSPVVAADGQIGSPSGAEANRLKVLTNVLADHPHLGITLAAGPATLDALPGGSSADRAIGATFTGIATNSNVEVLPSTYSGLSLTDLNAAGLGSEIPKQLSAGSAALSTFGASSQATWVVSGPLDRTTLNSLAGAGATNVVLPSSDLTALPESAMQTTFASPTRLADSGGPTPEVYAADPGLTTDFVSAKSPVLAANQLLAEMAMIQLELPSDRRGVVAMPPSGWATNPTFVSILLSGLEGNPLLDAVTAGELFATVPPASGIHRSLASSGNGTAVDDNAESPLADLISDSQAIRYARQQVTALGEILPGEAQLASTLGTELLIAESTAITEAERQSILVAATASANKLISRISLPGSSSITLTSRRGQIPLTILSSTGQPANVQLELTSQRLIFQPFNPPGGTCQIPTPTTEICQLTLVSENTTIKVPVQTQASGVFPLTVALYSPDGSLALPSDSDTVRSTAISGVGVILIVLAAVTLGVWWIRDLRHGRRARALVPAPEEPVDLTVAAGGAHAVEDHFSPAENGHDEGPPDGLYQDPVIRDMPIGDMPLGHSEEDPVAAFFSRPPPKYESRPGS